MASEPIFGINFTVAQDGELTISYDKCGHNSEPSKLGSEPTLRKSQLMDIQPNWMWGNEYSIVDVETTGLSAYKDAIIEIAALNVGPGFEIVSEYSTLVKTNQRVPHFIVELTGITQPDLDNRGIPLHDAISGFLAHVANRPIFAHNAPFDLGFIARAVELCGASFENPMHDSLLLAREAWPGLPSYKLATLAEQLGLEQRPTHRSLDDVKTTLALLRAAHETFNGIRTWSMPAPTSHGHQARPVARKGNTEGPLRGGVIAFTGELSLTREQAAELAAEAGCTVTVGVTKKTTMLVVGTQDLSVLAGYDKSSKHRKAEDLIAKGQAIRILTESDFLALVNNS